MTKIYKNFQHRLAVTICFNWLRTTPATTWYLLNRFKCRTRCLRLYIYYAPNSPQVLTYKNQRNHPQIIRVTYMANSSYFFLLKNSCPVFRGKHRQSLSLRLQSVEDFHVSLECRMLWSTQSSGGRGELFYGSGIPLNYSGESGVP